MSKVIVLGAKGRFGRAAITAFVEAGWDVRAMARSWDGPLPGGVTQVTGDVRDTAALQALCAGCDVIVNAVNPPYEDWSEMLPPITRSVIAAASKTGATVIIPGNVYNYGAGAGAVLREDTPWEPTSRKGQLRVEMEEAYRASGVRTLVVRGGDFLEAAQSGNWFDAHIAAKSAKGRTMYPGPMDQVHAWAYLPDMARATVALAERREAFASFEEFGFPGYALTGAGLVEAIEEAVGVPQKVSSLPWFLVRLMGLFQATMREVVEMRYLWRVPHRIDGAKLRATLPDFQPTPLDVAMKQILLR